MTKSAVSCCSVLMLAWVGCSTPQTQQRVVDVPNVAAGGWLNLPGGKKTLANEDLTGKALFVEFWATW